MDFQRRALVPQQYYEQPNAGPPTETNQDRQLTREQQTLRQQAQRARYKAELTRAFVGYAMDLELDTHLQAEQRNAELVAAGDALVQSTAGETQDIIAAIAYGHSKQQVHHTADWLDWEHDHMKHIGDQMLHDPEAQRGLFDWWRR